MKNLWFLFAALAMGLVVKWMLERCEVDELVVFVRSLGYRPRGEVDVGALLLDDLLQEQLERAQ